MAASAAQAFLSDTWPTWIPDAVTAWLPVVFAAGIALLPADWRSRLAAGSCAAQWRA